MKKLFPAISIISLIVVFIVINASMFVVNETEQVIITQFGQPVGETITEPGIHFKVPIIQDANFFDKRYLEWDGDRNQIPTKDKKFIFVDTYARWQITDPLQFFIRLKDERGAQSRLDDILDGETRNAIASHDLINVVRSTNRTPVQIELISDEIESKLDNITIGRDSIQKIVLMNANQRASDLGLKILDFRFKRVKYVEEVQQRVYERMISERTRIAEKFRSEGRGEASKISGEKEKELSKILSGADRIAAETRGKADAEAAAIYNAAYNRNQQSRELYEFIKTMEAYEVTFDAGTQVILTTESEFYKYLMRLR
ncbi:MAG: protease modulator HflC [Bacteroidetes bacterium]|nr:protease modulator HflC [Bacteroidota bacterium]